VEPVSNEADSIRILETKLLGRCLAEDVSLADGTTLPRNTEVKEPELVALASDPGITRVRVRSVLTCESLKGVCALCYGTMLATNKLVDQGEAIGIIAAQSIGEPGTQLTMRTFHTGGVAGEDITHGLPRVVELFEARTPKGGGVVAGISGVVRIGENEKGERVLTVVGDDEVEEPHAVARRTHLFHGIADGVEVDAGQQLTGDAKTPIDPKRILEVKGVRETQQYLSDEVQKVYREQGVSIHDKHIEVIVRQMLRRVNVSEPGDSPWLPGQQAEAREFAKNNQQLVAEGKQPAEGRPVLMGITKASLATDSWLSAASFQETTRVLTEAAIEGRSDSLVGLKENVIIGKLIPAGTGMNRYRDISTHAPDYEPLPFYSSDADADGDLDLAAWLADTSAPALDEGDGVALGGLTRDDVGDGEAGATVYTVPEFTAGATPSAAPPVAEPAEPVASDGGNGSVGVPPDALDAVDTDSADRESAADTSDPAALDEPEIGGAAAT
jgi:DNA-directed RNA polymerase subunit beta'